MLANLESFPKYIGKYMPDHKHGVNTSERELAEIGREAIAWRSTFEAELKQQLEEIQKTEKDPAYWRMASASQMQENETRKQFIFEILGPQLTRVLQSIVKEGSGKQ
jgi:putative N-acetylmannosamine-6-phosphate epimerase